MVPALLAALLFAQVPTTQTVVLPSRVTGIDASSAAKLSADLAAQLSALGVSLLEAPAVTEQKLRTAGMPSSSECAGNRECIAKLGAVLERAAVIAVDIGEVGGELAFHLELVDTATSARLAQSSFVLPSKPTAAEFQKPLKPFAAQVRAALAALKPFKRRDAPLAEAAPGLFPSNAQGEAAPVGVKARGSTVPSWALVSAGIASASTAGVFFAIGLNQRQALYGSRVDDGQFAPAYSRTEAAARAEIYDRNFQIAAGAAVLSLALATGAYLLWPEGP